LFSDVREGREEENERLSRVAEQVHYYPVERFKAWKTLILVPAQEEINRNETIEIYQEASKIATDNLSDLYCRLGQRFREDETIRDLSRSQELLETGLHLADFGSAEAESSCHFELGNVLRWRNCPPEEYIEHYRQAVALNPQYTQAYIQLGAAHYQLTGDVVQSENYIQVSLSISPSVRAYQELAKIYEQEKEYDEAIETYQRALRIEPDNQSIQNALTSLQERSN
jgi:tetratricopeptide (TPR) repeat protein